jgi:hypothetical protein
MPHFSKTPTDSGEAAEKFWVERARSALNELSYGYSENHDYCNEIFLYYVVNEYFERPSLVRLRSRITRKGRVEKTVTDFIFVLFWILVAAASALLYLIVFAMRFGRDGISERNVQSLGVIGDFAGSSKTSYLRDTGVAFFGDRLRYKFAAPVKNLYLLSPKSFLACATEAVVISARDYFRIYNSVRSKLPMRSVVSVLFRYVLRVPHKSIYEVFFVTLIRQFCPTSVYTSDKEDRFAILQKRICRHYGVNLICIPHGIEYGVRLPAGVAGDLVYCYSKNAKRVLEELYQDGQKFVYDEVVLKNMLWRKRLRLTSPVVVFFPESRGRKVNEVIVRQLLKAGIDFYIKAANKQDFVNYGRLIGPSKVLADFGEAISGGVCLARKSTVLVEAIFNGSRPIALLVNDFDRRYSRCLFPALSDEGILQVTDIGDLRKKIIENQ